MQRLIGPFKAKDSHLSCSCTGLRTAIAAESSKQRYPNQRWWKALRIRQPEDVTRLNGYEQAVDGVAFGRLESRSNLAAQATGFPWNGSPMQHHPCRGGWREASAPNGSLSF